MEKIKKYYNIGEVSKMCSIPISTLRYYDKIGLVVPDRIDDLTGYRYYSNTQLSIIDIITYFRYLNIPLKDIKAYLQEPGDGRLLVNLQKKLDILDEEIRDLTIRKDSIHFLQDQLEEILTGPPLGKVFIKKWPARSVRAIEARDITSEEPAIFNYKVRYIHNHLFPHVPVFHDQIGSIFSYRENIGKDCIRYQYIYLEVTSETEESLIRDEELPAGDYISVRYRWDCASPVRALNSIRQYLIDHPGLRIHDEIAEMPIVSGQPEMTGQNHVMEMQARILS